MSATLTFEGGRVLEQALQSLATKKAQSLGRKALRRAGNNILRKARENAPKDEKRLARAIRIRIDRLRNERAVLSALVYVSASAFPYRPRKTQRETTVKGKKGPPKYSYQIGSLPNVYGRFLEYGAPGRNIAARPWFRPAWYQEGGEKALGVLKEELAGLILEAKNL
jgi:HK97 gp10 family phage protein